MSKKLKDFFKTFKNSFKKKILRANRAGETNYAGSSSKAKGSVGTFTTTFDKLRK